jgi:hypothetical protein
MWRSIASRKNTNGPPVAARAQRGDTSVYHSTDNLGKQSLRDDGLPVCCKMLTIRTDIGRSASHVGYDNLDAACFWLLNDLRYVDACTGRSTVLPIVCAWLQDN